MYVFYRHVQVFAETQGVSDEARSEFFLIFDSRYFRILERSLNGFSVFAGHFGCMTAALSCLGIKLIGYSLLVEPWYAVPVEIVSAAGYPMFHVSMTAFASSASAAAPGTSATMQCLFGSTYEGLGECALPTLGLLLLRRKSVGCYNAMLLRTGI